MIVEVKGIGRVQFPDSMSTEQIQATIRKHYGPQGPAKVSRTPDIAFPASVNPAAAYFLTRGGRNSIPYVGGAIGEAVGGPVGAALGGGAGELVKQGLSMEPFNPGAAGGQALLQGSLGLIGPAAGMAGRGLSKIPGPLVKGAVKLGAKMIPGGGAAVAVHEAASKLARPAEKATVQVAEEVPAQISKLLDQYGKPIVYPARTIVPKVAPEARKLQLLTHPTFQRFMRKSPREATRVLLQFLSAPADATQ